MLLIIEKDRYINVKELAQFLSLSTVGVYRLIKEGKLPQGIKIGDSRRWNLEEIKEFLKN